MIKLYTGYHPSYFYQLRTAAEAKMLLSDFSSTIGDVVNRLTYDKSNFTKFFKEYAGTTPTEYRKMLTESSLAEH